MGKKGLCVQLPPGQLKECRARETERYGGLYTHSMGFPLISDMMELSPPRYS